jgi:hypothetical protein
MVLRYREESSYKMNNERKLYQQQNDTHNEQRYSYRRNICVAHQNVYESNENLSHAAYFLIKIRKAMPSNIIS